MGKYAAENGNAAAVKGNFDGQLGESSNKSTTESFRKQRRVHIGEKLSK